MRNIAPVLLLFLPYSSTEFLIGNGTWAVFEVSSKKMTWFLSVFVDPVPILPESGTRPRREQASNTASTLFTWNTPYPAPGVTLRSTGPSTWDDLGIWHRFVHFWAISIDSRVNSKLRTKRAMHPGRPSSCNGDAARKGRDDV